MPNRVLLNLISNALRFTPRGGEVRVEWRAMGDFVEICVSDDERGIPGERPPYVFLRGRVIMADGYGLPIVSGWPGYGRRPDRRHPPGLGSAFISRLPACGRPAR